MRLSHILCRVDDLRAAVADYRRLGFTVEWGSTPHTATNALIRFARGPFLELLTIPGGQDRPAATGVTGRVARWRARTGWVDLALETDDERLDRVHAALRRAGIPSSRPARHYRRRPDGVELTFWTLAPERDSLPFAMSAYQPCPPPPENGGTHPNGAVEVTGVVLGTPAVDRARRCWAAMLGRPDPRLEFVTAEEDGIVEVRLSGTAGVAFDPALLHGATLTVRP